MEQKVFFFRLLISTTKGFHLILFSFGAHHWLLKLPLNEPYVPNDQRVATQQFNEQKIRIAEALPGRVRMIIA